MYIAHAVVFWTRAALQEDIYEAVDDIYDEVAGVKAAKRSDRVTGKEEMQVRERMPLFLPGRIIHITRDTPRGGSGSSAVCICVYVYVLVWVAFFPS